MEVAAVDVVVPEVVEVPPTDGVIVSTILGVTGLRPSRSGLGEYLGWQRGHFE